MGSQPTKGSEWSGASMPATADRAFDKGELSLLPLSDCLMRCNDPLSIATLGDPKVVDESLLCRVVLTPRFEKKAKNGEGGASIRTPYWVGSPLLQGKGSKCRETCYENIAPFWAVPRTAKADHNMFLDTVAFDVAEFKTASGQKFPSLVKGHKFMVEVQVLRNSKKIAKGDKLCFLCE